MSVCVKLYPRSLSMCTEPKHRLFSACHLHYDNVAMETTLLTDVLNICVCVCEYEFSKGIPLNVFIV